MEIKGNTLYDANKQLVLEHESPLNHLEMARKQEELQEWFNNEVINYAMMLCHELRDYTIFHLNNSSTSTYTASKEVFICCLNRGDILGIDLTEDKQAYEIWLRIGKEAYCYYLFPYDQAVIDCDQDLRRIQK